MTLDQFDENTELSIPITLSENAGFDRIDENVSIGVPFPKGLIFDIDALNLFDDNEHPITIQRSVLSKWADDSLKWGLFDFRGAVPGGGKQKYYLRNPTWRPSEIVHDDTILYQGENKFRFAKKGAWDIAICPESGDFMKIMPQNAPELPQNIVTLGFVLTDARGTEFHPSPRKTFVERDGKIRTVFGISGEFKSKQKKIFGSYSSRIQIFHGTSEILLDFSIHNPNAALHYGGLWDLGDPSSLFFKDLSLNLDVNCENNNSNVSRTYTVHEPGETGVVKSLNNGDRFGLFQNSSGGVNWKSTNHVNRHGEVPLAFRGYRVELNGKIVDHGLRANPAAGVQTENCVISCGLKNFWQNFPKALQMEGKRISVKLFPEQFDDMFELQGGEQKTHTIGLSFDKNMDVSVFSTRLHHPIRAALAPSWIEQTGVFKDFCVSSWEESGDLDRWIKSIVNGPDSFFDRRETIDEYGWRNFGDVFADHEVREKQEPVPLISHYNNQYDLINSLLVQFARFKDSRWFELAEDLTQHVMDIDIYKTKDDKGVYNNGLFWHTNHFLDAATATHRSVSRKHLESVTAKNYGGGPALEHLYCTGLVNYFYFTGDPNAYDAALNMADLVMRQLYGSSVFVENLEILLRESILFIKTKISKNSQVGPYTLLTGPGRASGNALSVLLDVFDLTKKRKYILGAEKIIRNCVHPRDDISKRDLLNAGERWSYTVFLQAMNKYINMKLEHEEKDYMFSYACSTLIAYAKWMADNEYSFLDDPEGLDHPNFATRAAQDLRKCNILFYASQFVEQALGVKFVEKAEGIFQRTLSDLRKLDTRSSVRPLAILLQNGGGRGYMQKKKTKLKLNADDHDFGSPVDDVSSSILVSAFTGMMKSVKYFSLKDEFGWLKRRVESVFAK